MKMKKVIYIVAALIFIGVLLGRFFYPEGTFSVYEEKYRNAEKNRAEAISLKSPGKYHVGQDGLNEGFYDIKCTSGKVDMGSNMFLTENQIAKNVGLPDKDFIELVGKGKLSLKPATFSKLENKEGTYILDNTIGVFKVGDEIEPGEYNVELEVREDSYNFFIFLNSKDGESISSTQVQKGYDGLKFQLVLEEGNMLNIESRQFVKDFKITLNKK